MSFTWSIITDPAPSGFSEAVAFDGVGNWVVACDSGGLISSDGVNFTATSNPFGTGGSASDVVWTGGDFVACGNNSAFTELISAAPSPGSVWSTQSTPWDGSGTVLGLGYSSALNQLVACGEDGSGVGPVFMTSSGGGAWTPRSSTGDGGRAERAAWSPDLAVWVAVGAFGDGSSIMTSGDGISWTSVLAGGIGSDVCWSHDLGIFVAVAQSTFGGGTTVVTSSNGSTWTAQAGGGTSGADGVVWSSDFQTFVAAGETFPGVMVSKDGISWTRDTEVPGDNFFGGRLAAGNSEIVVSGRDVNGTSRVLIGLAAPTGGLHVWQRF